MANTEDGKSNLNQLERVREIHRLIVRYTENPQNETLRVTAGVLARKLHVTDRQIRRDVQVLIRRIEDKDVESGHGAEDCALQYDAKKRTYRYTRDVDLSVWVGRLNNEELGSLLVAQQALAVFSGMPLAKHVEHIFEEDAGGLVGNHRSTLRKEITDLISFHPEGAGVIDEGHFATIYRGLLLGQQLEVAYQSRASDRPVIRILHPYHLCCFRQQWRLIAHDSRHGEIRDFVVTKRRLHSVKLLNEPFERPENFSRQEVHDRISGLADTKKRLVRLRVARAGAHHIRDRKWVALQSVSAMKDGSIEAAFAVGDLGEFKRFVLAFGSDCEVLEPADFRDEIVEEARKVLEREKR